MSKLTDRIRGIVGTPQNVGRVVAPAHAAVPQPGAADFESVLGGTWRDAAGARCFVVERRVNPATRHGRVAVGTLAEWIDDGTPDATLFAGGTPATAPFVFFGTVRSHAAAVAERRLAVAFTFALPTVAAQVRPSGERIALASPWTSRIATWSRKALPARGFFGALVSTRSSTIGSGGPPRS